MKSSFKEKIYLSDLRNISEEEFVAAIEICKKISSITMSRQDYIQHNNIHAHIANPDRNWKMTDSRELSKPYDIVVKHHYDVINRLRFFSQNFTGYRLASFSPSFGKSYVDRVPDNFDELLRKIARPDRFVHRFIDMTRYVPEEIIAKPPKLFGEVGWDVNGNIVNYDVYAYQERINLLYEAGIINLLKNKISIQGSVNIVEIGSGYGGLAYFLKEILPQANFYLIDLPESLLFSTLYLSIAHSRYKYIIYDGTEKRAIKDDFDYFFIPNFLFDDLVKSDLKIDLAINTLSFVEMSESQVEHYAQGLTKLLGEDGILFEENHKVAASANFCNHKEILSHIFYENEIKTRDLVTLSRIIQGVPRIWTNRAITEIIPDSCKPFNSSKWKFYRVYKEIKSILNLRFWGAAFVGWFRQIIKK